MVQPSFSGKLRLLALVATVGLFLFAYSSIARPLASSIHLGREAAPVVESQPGATVAVARDEMRVTSNGSLPSDPVVLNSSEVPRPQERPRFIAPPSESRTVIVVEDVLREHGRTVFPSLAAMPEEARYYYLSTVEQVADFFGVRAEDVIAVVQEADPSGGLRLLPPSDSPNGTRGVAQASARMWNGWANPQATEHSTDQRAIDQFGGVGFDWAQRAAWQAWRAGRSNGNDLRQAEPNPDVFENSLAGAARHLAQWGLTQGAVTRDRAAFERRLADAIAVYVGGEPLSETEYARWRAERGMATIAPGGRAEPSVAPVVMPELRSAFWYAMDQQFGVALGERELSRLVDRSPVAAQVAAGALGVQEGAAQLLEAVTAQALADGAAALEDGQAMRWPFVHDGATLAAQRLAVEQTGHTLTPWELDELIQEARGNENVMARTLSRRSDARLFAATRQFLDRALKRSERGLPVTTQEVNALVQPVLATYPVGELSVIMLQGATDQIEFAVRVTAEYRELNGITQFAAMPLQPTPSRIIKRFGSRARYQPGGTHTGIDLRNPREGGQQPLLYAVDRGTVVHIGPIYCNRPEACRGPYAIIIHHGNHVYTVYSHNSEAHVQAGDVVEAGQPIGRQGDEGYSMGPHLHFEVHTGAPYTGNWEVPFNGGQFVDPLPWLPPSHLKYS